jgi:DNA mismatch repair protein MutS
VVDRARTILDELEAADRQAPVEKLVDDLPLFAAARPSSAAPAPVEDEPDPLREMLAAADPDALTPREALDLVYRLAAAAQKR